MNNKNLMIISAISAVSVTVGFAAGYFVARKRLEQEFEDLAKREIAEAKQFYSVLHKKDKFETPEAAVAELIPSDEQNEFTQAATAMKVYQGDLEDKIQPHDVIQQNVFVAAQVNVNLSDADWEKELRNRTEEAPYVLNQQEFMANDNDNVQVTLTYYAGDKTLVDEREDLIDNIDKLIGEYNLEKFGHWSGDARILYVRNDVKDLDFEIVLDDRKYAEVAGIN